MPLKSVSEAKKLGEDFATAIGKRPVKFKVGILSIVIGCGKNNDYDCLYSKVSTINSTIILILCRRWKKLLMLHQKLIQRS